MMIPIALLAPAASLTLALGLAGVPSVGEEEDVVGESRLVEILDGETPETVGELRALEGHVQRLVERVLPATISLSRSSGVLVRRGGRTYALGTAHTTRVAGRKVPIRTNDGTDLQGVTLGAEHQSDLGLVQVETEVEYPAVPIGTTADVQPEQWVLMLGHPSGRKPDRTAAVRLGRVLRAPIGGFLITDCLMQEGDSGGPLFDMHGRLIGINSRCTPSLAVNLHGQVDALVANWSELQEGRVTQATARESTGALLAAVVGAESLSQGDAMRKLWTVVAAPTNRSVVRVIIDGEERALGTVVAPDLVVTKYSELSPDREDAQRSCRQGEESWPCSLVGCDRPADLALLRITGGRLEPIVWHDATPGVGAFVASPDGEAEPTGVGVLSTSPYLHTQPHILFGTWFENWFEGQPEIQKAIEHGAAHSAGLRDGDVVVQFDGEAVSDAQQLLRLISQRRFGDRVEVIVERLGKKLTFEATLGGSREFMRSRQEQVWGPLSDVRRFFDVVLQHDTVLIPANCGGPLIDLEGRAVGLNIARAGRVETLALPAGEVERLVKGLIVESQQAQSLPR